MSTTRIPLQPVAFNSYLINTTNYLNDGNPTKNSDRLGITADEMLKWNSIHEQWQALYPLYIDKPMSRTKAVITQLQSTIEELHTFNKSKHLLDRIASSPNATAVDLEIFNIKTSTGKKSATTLPIQSAVLAAFQVLGGGSLTVKCRSENSQRPGIIAEADSVQMVYMVGTTPPESADMPGLNKELSSKSTFVLSLGSASSGKSLYIYFRWYNSRHPELAGPWSAMYSTLIL